VYRALIKEVRVLGVFSTAPTVAQSLPVVLTHLGDSRLRVKRDANPFAPPIELPACFVANEGKFLAQVDDECGVAFVRALDAATAVLDRERAQIDDPSTTPYESIPATGAVGVWHQQIATLAPQMVAAKAKQLSCGYVDARDLQETARAAIERVLAEHPPFDTDRSIVHKKQSSFPWPWPQPTPALPFNPNSEAARILGEITDAAEALVSLAVAAIPMAKQTMPASHLAAIDSTGALSSVLPAITLDDTRRLVIPTTPTPVALANVWGTTLTATIPKEVFANNLLYDLLFAITVRVPVAESALPG
jgi:hypothetical protein